MQGDLITLCLAGDVMLGRGVDQILPHPGDPALAETYVRDARSYVELAEAANGPLPRPVDFSWPWGDTLRLLDRAASDAVVLNLETSITRSDDFAPDKAVHYRMHPANLPCLISARPDVCVLANNHILDFGRRGLAETLEALAYAGIASAGAGHDAHAARQPHDHPRQGRPSESWSTPSACRPAESRRAGPPRWTEAGSTTWPRRRTPQRLRWSPGSGR